jgi:hypothetical protein
MSIPMARGPAAVDIGYFLDDMEKNLLWKRRAAAARLDALRWLVSNGENPINSEKFLCGATATQQGEHAQATQQRGTRFGDDG